MVQLLFPSLLLYAVLFAKVASLPIYPSPVNPYETVVDSPRSLDSTPVTPTWFSQPSSSHPISSYWIAVRDRSSSQVNHSNGAPPQLPSFHSGPWGEAYEAVNNIVDRLKIFKRSFSPRVQEEIAQHLRPKNWWQRIQDFWRRITFRRLKVTRLQVDEVKAKYGYVGGYAGARGYRSGGARGYGSYRTQMGRNGRMGSAFPTRPRAGQGRSTRPKTSRFSR